MSTEPTNQPGGNWGDPAPAGQPERPKWSGRKIAAAAGVAVVIAAAGGVAIYAGTSANGEQAGGMGQGGGRMFPGGPQGSMGGAAGALGSALHGDFVVPDGNGGYRTERLQTGEVTAISATSITTASKDGYTQTYTIDTGTKKSGEPKNGDTVTVLANVSGETATATAITEPGQSQPGGRGRQDGQQGGPPPGQ
ncbi:hypothetical protein [Amycolatopsis nigrescens]|uniref:hypothetical protein n=1 Tax=Amycolatopsis nigrescens TaxID=381445 RepID=UPI0003716637|nr:hypothetical protein [Amycolatopsis nigrescens]